ncbi:hypothetical protein [Microlunatus sp. GCM10028923]|uniref:hypothetical protein n=1 Tax=Microlunatus sp. GCM10028923 TaxID=3273400 RepID=UPI00361AE353
MTARLVPAIAGALPGLVLAGIGLVHPHDLAPATAGHWITLHVWLVPIFPLLGLALLIPGWTAPRWARILLAALIFLYVVYYGALDAVAGIGAGIAVQRNQVRGDVDHWLLEVGNSLGWVGSIAFLAAALLVAALVFRRVRGPALIPGLILVGASVSFLNSHIYAPRGVITVLLIGLATGWLTWVAGRRSPGTTTSPG